MDLNNYDKPQLWDKEPVFVFTTDIDWVSEPLLHKFFENLPLEKIKLSCFVTHYSKIIHEQSIINHLQTLIHPNFAPNSSQGTDLDDIIKNLLEISQCKTGFRTHKLFINSDISYKLFNEYNFRFSSNAVSYLKPEIKPYYEYSGLVEIPIYFEDGTHLYLNQSLDFSKFKSNFLKPGLKVISFHPFHYVMNTPDYLYGRKIKDSISWKEFQNLDLSDINLLKNYDLGIATFLKSIFDLVLNNDLLILSLEDVYKRFTDSI